MCRRLIAALISVCSRKLLKIETLKPEKFTNLLETGNYYLDQWQERLSYVATKANKKFDITPVMIEKISISSSEGEHWKHLHTTNKHIPKVEDFDTPNKRELQHKTILLQKIKTGTLEINKYTSQNEVESPKIADENTTLEDSDSNLS